MDENVFSSILLNKTETLGIIKPFYCPFRHGTTPFWQNHISTFCRPTKKVTRIFLYTRSYKKISNKKFARDNLASISLQRSITSLQEYDSNESFENSYQAKALALVQLSAPMVWRKTSLNGS